MLARQFQLRRLNPTRTKSIDKIIGHRRTIESTQGWFPAFHQVKELDQIRTTFDITTTMPPYQTRTYRQLKYDARLIPKRIGIEWLKTATKLKG